MLKIETQTGTGNTQKVGTSYHSQFHTLDALRGVSAAAVVLYHASFFYCLARPSEAFMAVDLFFVMSGFIIAYRYESDLVAGVSPAIFMKIRLIRLYPMFFLGLVLGAIPALIAVLFAPNSAFYWNILKSFPLASAMLPSWFATPQLPELFPLNYVAWSLVLEVLINTIYALTCRFWSPRFLVSIISIALLGLCLSAYAYGSLLYGFAWYGAPVGLARVTFGFCAGIAIFRLYQRGLLMPLLPWWAVLSATAALFILDPPISKPVWEFVSVAFIIPAIVMAAVMTEPPPSLRSVCAFAGLMSYPIYSLHAPYIGIFVRTKERLHFEAGAQSTSQTICFTACLALMCYIAHICYDAPIRKWLNKIGRGFHQLPPHSTMPNALKRHETDAITLAGIAERGPSRTGSLL